MAFEREVAPTPVGLGDISVTLFQADPAGTESNGVRFSVQVRLSDGTVRTRRGDLVPHLTTTQRNALQNFMNDLRTKAIAEFLP